MSHEIMMDTNGNALAIFARGTGKVQTVWHQAMTACAVLDADTLRPSDIPDRILPDIRLVTPIDPETFDELTGLSIIKANGIPGRLGQAGGHKRTSWTPAQPKNVAQTLAKLTDIGAEFAGAFWLNPGRLYLEGKLPTDATWGGDPHEVRFCAILDYTGAGCDRLAVYLTRIVCANTSRIALYEANKGKRSKESGKGGILSIRHSAGVEDAWELDAPAFLADYSDKVKAHIGKLETLNARTMDKTEWADFFIGFLGGEMEADASKRVATRREREMAALRAAWVRERENARNVGINPDSLRVGYEAITNVMNHGAMVDTPKGEEWRPVLNGARNATARVHNLTVGATTDKALNYALRFEAEGAGFDSAKNPLQTVGASVIADMLG